VQLQAASNKFQVNLGGVINDSCEILPDLCIQRRSVALSPPSNFKSPLLRKAIKEEQPVLGVYVNSWTIVINIMYSMLIGLLFAR
jgi:hypothetical protein